MGDVVGVRAAAPVRARVEPEPRASRPPTEIEVTFTDEGGKTRVDLEHRGWERLGEHAARRGRATARAGSTCWPPTRETAGS